MILLTDRIVEATRLQQVLGQVRPCALAPIHQALVQPAVFTTIICDVKLDTAESFALINAALAHYRTKPSIPVIFLLRDPSVITKEQACQAGATAMLPHTASSEQILTLVKGFQAADAVVGAASRNRISVATATEDTVATLANIFDGASKCQPIAMTEVRHGGDMLLKAIKQVTIQSWLDVVSAYDDVTYQHCLLVAGLTAAFALELGLQPSAQQLLVQAALVHDLGKAQIPHGVLNKPGKLDAGETEIMRKHVLIGHELLKRQQDINPVLLDVTRHHHELLDGTGYPDHLQGDQISRPVRMSTICDIYAALVERRPYKQAMAPEAALAHLDRMGPKLDRTLVRAFRGVVIDRKLTRAG